jgi:hypothetical protein
MRALLCAPAKSSIQVTQHSERQSLSTGGRVHHCGSDFRARAPSIGGRHTTPLPPARACTASKPPGSLQACTRPGTGASCKIVPGCRRKARGAARLHAAPPAWPGHGGRAGRSQCARAPRDVQEQRWPDTRGHLPGCRRQGLPAQRAPRRTVSQASDGKAEREREGAYVIVCKRQGGLGGRAAVQPRPVCAQHCLSCWQPADAGWTAMLCQCTRPSTKHGLRALVRMPGRT